MLHYDGILQLALLPRNAIALTQPVQKQINGVFPVAVSGQM
jgi:hypothetical protein